MQLLLSQRGPKVPFRNKRLQFISWWTGHMGWCYFQTQWRQRSLPAVEREIDQNSCWHRRSAGIRTQDVPEHCTPSLWPCALQIPAPSWWKMLCLFPGCEFQPANHICCLVCWCTHGQKIGWLKLWAQGFIMANLLTIVSGVLCACSSSSNQSIS